MGIILMEFVPIVYKIEKTKLFEKWRIIQG